MLAGPRSDLRVIPLGAPGSPEPVEVARLYDRAFQRAHFYLPDTPRSDAEAVGFFLGTDFYSSPAIATFCAIAGGQTGWWGNPQPTEFRRGRPGERPTLGGCGSNLPTWRMPMSSSRCSSPMC